ncbi:DJ-1/PfpI family protein [Actinomadura mexicana]|uniref:DJ-1/PfpI family protein n=1 Tax=Actinomadura mexicana TaxID=134959 RepID=A0A238VR65_9ACTN|nr:DJ-1/PfpI family protein [Actinomadura mexicana]SNR36637.1 DJ-1/PfpI family protein [Actinomadura mexicana]
MRVAFVIYDGFQILDLTGPHEVFEATGRYECLVVGRRAGPVTASGGLRVHAPSGPDLAPESIDTLVVAGGAGVDEARGDAALVGWVARTARTARRVASVCSGALLLAEAGVLEGRRVTTHWGREEQLQV